LQPLPDPGKGASCIGTVKPWGHVVKARLGTRRYQARLTSRLHEHRELRGRLGPASAPDYSTLYRLLKRLGDDAIQQTLGSTVRRLRLARCHRRARVAVDATCLSQAWRS
jgi:hypothetical protein